MRHIINTYEIMRKNQYLQKSKETYEMIASILPHAIILLQDDKVKLANEVALKLLDLKKEDKIIEKDFFSFINIECREKIVDLLKELNKKGLIIKKEEKITRLDGEILSIELTATLTEILGENTL